jgi:hypothetical protein
MEAQRASQQSHLSDEQFSDLLLGAKPAAVRAHLDACPQCSAEAERVSAAIGSFEQQSRLWAERRAATALGIQGRDRQPVLPWLRQPQARAAAVALAIAVAVGIGIGVRNDRVHTAQPQVANVQPAGVVSPETLKADNELLAAIDGELRADESAPASMYGLTAASRSGRARVSKRISNE